MISKSQAETEVSLHLEKSSLEGWMRRLGSRTACDRCRVPLDKSEGSVKGKVVLCSAWAPLALPERLRTKALAKSPSPNQPAGG